MWQNNAVTPAVVYYTTGGGNWYELNVTGFGVSSVTGTANQITATPTTGAVVLSLPSPINAPGAITSPSQISAPLLIATGPLGVQSSGPLTAAKIQISTGANASIGISGAMSAGTITITTTAVTASSIIFVSVNTAGGTPGILSVPNSSRIPGTSFAIVSQSGSDTSTVNWWIIN